MHAIASRSILRCVSMCLIAGLLLPGVVFAQQQDWPMRPAVGSGGEGAEEAVRRYRTQRLSSAYYDPSDTVPAIPYGPKAPEGYRPPPRKDAHAGVRGYRFRSCERCHEGQASNVHTLRANNTCRQCHGGDPIASVGHYFSPMNTIRRHAYVCAKCHEGSSASFATYVVHEPVASAPETRRAFPALYYGYLFMFLLIVGVFIVFIPHGVLWWIREWFVRSERET